MEITEISIKYKFFFYLKLFKKKNIYIYISISLLIINKQLLYVGAMKFVILNIIINFYDNNIDK